MTIFEDFVAFSEYFLWWSVKFYKSRILSIAQKGILERQQNLQKTSKNLIFQKTFWESTTTLAPKKYSGKAMNAQFFTDHHICSIQLDSQKVFWEINFVTTTTLAPKKYSGKAMLNIEHHVCSIQLDSQKVFWKIRFCDDFVTFWELTW